jgi:16S rRNA (guanine527-N7)-methyltransferase
VSRASLVEVLADAQQRGYLGTDAVEAYLDHGRAYLDALGDPPASTGPPLGVDLGSGGGIPGLVLALELPDSAWWLVERSRTRADWLARAVARLGMIERVVVRHEPAERTGRGPVRGRATWVVARSFGPPAVVAECAAPLLQVGGRVLCSDRDDHIRWDAAGLDELGLGLVRRWRRVEGSFVVLEQRRLCPDRFPRSPGVPARRPLF